MRKEQNPGRELEDSYSFHDIMDLFFVTVHLCECLNTTDRDLLLLARGNHFVHGKDQLKRVARNRTLLQRLAINRNLSSPCHSRQRQGERERAQRSPATHQFRHQVKGVEIFDNVATSVGD